MSLLALFEAFGLAEGFFCVGDAAAFTAVELRLAGDGEEALGLFFELFFGPFADCLGHGVGFTVNEIRSQ